MILSWKKLSGKKIANGQKKKKTCFISKLVFEWQNKYFIVEIYQLIFYIEMLIFLKELSSTESNLFS